MIKPLIKLKRSYKVISALSTVMILAACSEPQTGPQWQCVAFTDDISQSERQTKCNVQVDGEQLSMRLVKKQNQWYLLAFQPKGGQVKGKVTIKQKRGDDIVLEAHANQKQCNSRDCIFPLDDAALKAIQKSRSIEVEITRTSIRREMVKSQNFAEEFSGRDLKKALAQAEQ